MEYGGTEGPSELRPSMAPHKALGLGRTILSVLPKDHVLANL